MTRARDHLFLRNKGVDIEQRLARSACPKKKIVHTYKDAEEPYESKGSRTVLKGSILEQLGMLTDFRIIP